MCFGVTRVKDISPAPLGAVDARVEPPTIDLPSRYAAFRETVERVVRERAPAARIVTDWHGDTANRVAGCVAWVTVADVTVECACSLGMSERTVAEYVADRVDLLCDKLGARAMGKK